MRIVALIVSVLLSTALLMGAVLLVAFSALDDFSGWQFGADFAVVMLVYGPLTLGSFRAYWNVTGSDESRRYHRRLVAIVLGVEVLAAVYFVVEALATSTGWLLPVVTIGGGAVLTAVALVVGPALYRYDAAHARPRAEFAVIDPAAVRRRVTWIAATFVVILVIGTIAFVVIDSGTSTLGGFGVDLLFGVEFASLGAAMVCIFSTVGWNRRLREVTDQDPGRLRRVARVVLRGKAEQLDERDLVAAARYASVVSITMAFQTAYFVLLYASIVIQQIVSFGNGFGQVFSIALIVFLLAILAFVLPLQIVRLRRARAYARAHAVALAPHGMSHAD